MSTPTDEVQPVTSSLINLREVPLNELFAVCNKEGLRRIGALAPTELPVSFNSSIG